MPKKLLLIQFQQDIMLVIHLRLISKELGQC